MVFILFHRTLANSKDHMSMSVREIEMNETESKSDHLVITHQPFSVALFFSPKHGASDSISRAQDRRKPNRNSNSHLPPFLLFCHGFEIPFLRAIKGVSLEGHTDDKQCL